MTHNPKDHSDVWKCAGCGIESPDKIRRCDCVTDCLYRGKAGNLKHALKFQGCTNHPDRPLRENLDGEDLCLECCIAWAKSEGDAIKEPDTYQSPFGKDET